MNSSSSRSCHVAVMPWPGRGHINPMMNLCKFLSSRNPNIMMTFVVTEEWLGYIGSEPKPDSLRFATIPNVVPPERLKGADFPAFYSAAITKMEAPFELLLNRLEPKPVAIIADVELLWGAEVGRRRNIPVALLWTMSVSFFATLYYFNNRFPQRDKNMLLESLAGEDEKNNQVKQIPELSPTQASDLLTVIHQNDPKVLNLLSQCISNASKAQYLLLNSVSELEPHSTLSLRSQFPFPLYTIGPAIPHQTTPTTQPHYLQWLNSHPKDSVLYVSLGSFLSLSSAQMDEIATGLCDSGVPFLWVARGEATRLNEVCQRGGASSSGLVVPWCEQFRVLCHPCVGGFLTHCGWNSTLEGVFAGVPMLGLPLFLDQFPNRRQIVEEWGVGLGLGREDVCGVVKRFMERESGEGREMRKRSREFGDVCRRAVEEGGSSDVNLNAFIEEIMLRCRASASAVDE